MGLTKRIFIDRDPAYEDVRRRYQEEASAHIRQFPFRIPTRRRNTNGDRPHWDPYWPSCIDAAVKELEIEVVRVNDGVFTRTKDECFAAKARAEELWRQRLEQFAAIRLRK